MNSTGQGSLKAFLPPAKPPIINIYCCHTGGCNTDLESKEFVDLRKTLHQCINTEMYVVYHLKQSQLINDPWVSNTELLVISSCCQGLHQPDNILSENVANYLSKGGKVLCFAPGVLETQQKEKRHDMLRTVTMEYAKQKLQVAVQEEIQEWNECKDLMLEGSKSSVLAHCCDDPGSPLIMRVEFPSSKMQDASGIAVISHAVLDKDPAELSCDSKIFTTLKSSNASRFNVLTDILSNHLGIDCSMQIPPVLTSAVLLSQRPQLKEELLQAVYPKLQDGYLLQGAEVSLLLVDTEKQLTTPATERVLPVLTNANNFQLQYFQPDIYWKNLQTKVLGQTMVYVDVVPTTMPLLDPLMNLAPQKTGLVAVAGRQTHGRGRGGNRWVSPEGCVMFTLHVQQDANSDLGCAPVFLQHLCGLAMVLSIRQIPGYEDLDLKIKWSNDIVFGGHIKLGGVLVNSMIINGVLHAIIGAGLNVSNSNPTACVNDVIRQANFEKMKQSADQTSVLKELTKEEVLARIITIFEQLMEKCTREGLNQFKNQLYKYWIHSEITKFQLEMDDGHQIDVRVEGLDSEGHLTVTAVDSGQALALNSLKYSMDVTLQKIFKKRT